MDEKLATLRQREQAALEAESRPQKRQSPGCPNNCSGHGQCWGLDCSCYSGYAGEDCSIPDTSITPGRALNGSVSTFAWQYYHFQLPFGRGFVVTVNQTVFGDADVFVLKGDYPTLNNWLVRDITMQANVALEVWNATAGLWYVGLYGFIGVSYTINVTLLPQCPNGCSGHGTCQSDTTCVCASGWFGPDCSAQAAPLTSGTNVTGQVLAGSWNYYAFTAAQGAAITLLLGETSPGLNDDCDLYLAAGRVPTQFDFDYSNDTKNSFSSIVLPSAPRQGTYFLGVYGYTGCQYVLAPTVGGSAAACPNNCSLHGQCAGGTCACSPPGTYNGSACELQLNPLILSGPPVRGFVSVGAWNYFWFRLNTASPLVLTVNQTSVWNAGDCDLYVRRSQLPTRTAYDLFDISANSVFSVNIPVGEVTWWVGLYGWSGSVSFALSLLQGATCNCLHGSCVSGQCVCAAGWGGDACDLPLLPLLSTAPVTGAVSSGQYTYYALSLPSTATLTTITLRQTTGSTDYLWLYADMEDPPTILSHDFAARQSQQPLQELVIRWQQPLTPPPATLYIAVYGNPFAPQGLAVPYQLVAWVPPSA